jgi:hypothetical protein
MVIRRSGRSVPVQPLLVMVTILVALVLAFGVWYSVGRGNPGSGLSSQPGAAATVNMLTPDAQERNQQILQARQSKAETTHGH